MRILPMGLAPAFDYLTEPVRRAVLQAGIVTPTPPQLEASPLIARGENVLIVAPTGSGKTEAAIIPCLDRLVKTGVGDGISLIYVTPMRALNRDMLKRLELWASRLKLTIEVRHGDTPPSQRRKQSERPPNLLVTTPETLQAILPGSRMRNHLRGLKILIVDELHNLLESKRGVQLCVALERLRRLCGEFQLIGLSATIGAPEEAARFLFGPQRKCQVVKVATPKEFRYTVEYPTPDDADAELSRSLFAAPEVAARLSLVNDLIDSHTSALAFVNSRTMAEMVGEKLGRIRGDTAVHHGSLPRDERERVEVAFKNGQLKALVCTSTLELGIDIGSVDLVVQYMSPRQVTSLIQRVGRSGHSLDRSSEGVIITVSADDILESAAAILEAREGRLEPTRPYSNCLDVLAHQIVGYAMDTGEAPVDLVFEEIRRAYPYRDLERERFDRVLKYLNDLRKIRVGDGLLKKSRASREYYFENLSMIPDETRYVVIDLTTNQMVGILGEEFMLLKARVGLHFICKGKVWQIEKIADDHKVYVTPVDDPLAAIPGWDGEMLPIPFELAQRAGRLRSLVSTVLGSQGVDEAVKTLSAELPVSPPARRRVVEEIAEQKRMGAAIPSDRLILLEGFGKYLVIHACFGEAVNRTLAYAFEEILSRRGLIRVWWMDGYRILMELTVDTAELDLQALARSLFEITPEELEKTYRIAVQRNFPFPSRVKTVAERFGALKKGTFISHPNLCSLPTRFEDTPIYEEALREAERDLIDLGRAWEIVSMVARRAIDLATFLAKDRPTPMGYHILYRYLEVPELVAPDALVTSIVERMKLSIYHAPLDLACFRCGASMMGVTLVQLSEEPQCRKCSSKLLTPLYWRSGGLGALIARKLAHQELTKEEGLELARARQAADLVLAYGKQALVALSVYGIGPQTAAKLLARMHEDEESFYKDLLEAKMRFITTRPFWSG